LLVVVKGYCKERAEMLKMELKTKLVPEEVIRRALAFFGPGGYGLEVKKQLPGYICLENGGGVVEVTASAESQGSSVELLSREWDYQLKEFMAAIG
jgi:hypothetical protein